MSPAAVVRSAKKQAAPVGAVSNFVDQYFHHFNAATLKDAAHAWIELLDRGGYMFVAMAGAMSTAELGRILAPMIRSGKVHGLSVTGANMEEDVFVLLAYDHYERFQDYQELVPKDDIALAERHINRVTDTGIPEAHAMKPLEEAMMARWKHLKKAETSALPHEPLYDVLNSGELSDHYEGDPAHSWMLAAAEVDLPLFVPGWEDSTLGQVFTAECFKGTFEPTIMKSGIQYGVALADWYLSTSQHHDMGFMQLGGGIAGDFSICTVPMLKQDCDIEDTPLWQYFCQITDSHESVGGYSGAMPTEKRSWGKLPAKCPSFAIFGDSSVCAPLLFARVLGW